MPETDVVHLVWKPAGLEAFRKFVRSYSEHPAGAEHELIILYNGFRGDDLADYRSSLQVAGHRELLTPRPSLDIAAPCPVNRGRR